MDQDQLNAIRRAKSLLSLQRIVDNHGYQGVLHLLAELAKVHDDHSASALFTDFAVQLHEHDL